MYAVKANGLSLRGANDGVNQLQHLWPFCPMMQESILMQTMSI